jgi:DNA-binding transcriptional ArsR family regulator
MVLRGTGVYSELMADIFDVIADRTRRDILQLLLDRSLDARGGTSVSQIVQALGVSQPTVSKHLKVLRDAELVSVREEGQHRYYSLEAAPLDEVDDWLVRFFAADEVLPATLPDSAAQAADAVGRAAASAKHAVAAALRKFPGR